MSAEHYANSGTTVDINPALAVANNSSDFGDVTAVHYPGGDLTYSELEKQSAKLAAALSASGVVAKDRVAYCGLNSSALLVTMLAAFRLGAVFVPLNFRLACAELCAVLEISDAVALVCEEGHRASVEAISRNTPLRVLILVDTDCSVCVSEPLGGWSLWSAALAQAAPHPTVFPATFDSTAILMFTSGTTGVPKGVALTYGNLWWNSVNVDSRLDTLRRDVTYATAPLFHIGALNSFTLRALTRGGSVVVRRGFDPEQFRDDLVEFKVNSVFAVPSMLTALSRVPGIFESDFTSLRSVVVAGAPVAPSLIHLYAQHGIFLQQAWGLTETSPFATHLPVEKTWQKAGSAGLPMPYTQVRVVDPATNEPVAADVAGEVIVRGPNVTPGYWRNPKATADAFDEEGWFHSGDIGYLDSDGYLYIVDRLKDLIISGGENVYPAEVERVLADMPGIDDIAVVGMRDDKWGETVVAVVVLAPETTVTLADIREYAGVKLARYKLPTQLRVVGRVQRNQSGKLMKTAIRDSLNVSNSF